MDRPKAILRETIFGQSSLNEAGQNEFEKKNSKNLKKTVAFFTKVLYNISVIRKKGTQQTHKKKN